MVKLSFASERPVERWDWNGPYDEILRVDQSSADLARMNDAGALLSDHNREKQIGVVEKAWVGSDRRAHAIVRFSDSPSGQQEFNDVVNGIRRNVSFAYKIRSADTVRGEKGKKDVVTATDWEVLEISLVSVPADASVGVGRSEPAKIEQGQVLPEEVKVEEKQERVVNKMKTEEQTGVVEVTESREDQILAFGRKFQVDERWLKSFALNPTNTVEGLRGELQKQFEVKQVTEAAPEDPSKLGLSEKETKRYSLSRAIMGSIDPKYREAAAFEIECHESIVKRGLETQAGGFFVPTEVQTQKRTDLSVAGGLTLGSALVGTDHMPESFIDLLRNNMVTRQLGISIMSGLVGNPSIPRQDSAGTAYWIAEGGTPTESNITFGQLGLTPHALGAVQEFTRQLLIQSQPSVDALVMNDIAAILAREIDRAIIDGSGSAGQPKGILNTTGVDEVSQLGAVFSWADAVAFETAVLEDNAGLGTPKWLMRPSVAGALKTLEKTPTSPTGTYLMGENGRVNGYQAYVSTQVPVSTLIFGDFSQVILAEWGSLEIVANDRGATFRNGNIEVRGLHMVDVQVRYPQALKKLEAFSAESSS
jgi:HK97 family phage major capsid protein